MLCNRPRSSRACQATVVVVVCFLAIGCGSGGNRFSVRGEVTADGQPLAEGSINFQPTGSTTGNTAGAMIKDGRYTVAANAGLAPGEYRVSIQGMHKTGKMVQDAQRGPVPEVVPLRFVERNLTAAVSADSRNEFDFDLTTEQ